MGFGQVIYRRVFSRTSTAFIAVIGGAFLFERGLDGLADTIFDNVNKGKQWKDIKHRYEN